MICEKCGRNMRCTDSRWKDNKTRRRWRCECGERIFTLEVEEMQYYKLEGKVAVLNSILNEKNSLLKSNK